MPMRATNLRVAGKDCLFVIRLFVNFAHCAVHYALDACMIWL